MNIVIIGAGLAGASAAKELRDELRAAAATILQIDT